MILWFLLDKYTQSKLKRTFPGIKPPKLEKTKEIVITPNIKLEDIVETMTQIPGGRNGELLYVQGNAL